MIGITHSGSTDRTEKFLKYIQSNEVFAVLSSYGQMGVDALSRATPIDTGRAASSWWYSIERKRNRYTLNWGNDDIEGGVPVIILLQYGHGTGTGGYVQGRDFINPAIKPVFDKIAAEVWERISRA